MKTYSILCLSLIALITSSFSEPENGAVNSNSWSISIGKKEILASYKGNKMGDLATIETASVKPTDVLVAKRYLCGMSAQDATSTLIFKNSSNDIINETQNTDDGMTFFVRLPMAKILESPNFEKGIVDVYFVIDTKVKTEKKDAVLLGRLNFK
ncbi:MAG: hypothetical protein EOO50_13350 [Flavobacterium sp.]|uniref:hypothetical protein n=1 Tax=Flavobacterium sp. TaxID=239 RepID=UPI001221791E|nr:hypothetical protein [Flavobacterium sp.]RZJ65527.1 MAG: hypothetical protein EOO50_13350 [Flavobacterium sp.]